MLTAIRRVSKACAIYVGCLLLVVVAMPTIAPGICGLDRVALEQLRGIEDPQVLRALTQRININGTCSLCHVTRFGGPRNEFGAAVNVLLTVRDRENPVRHREVGARLRNLLANPSLPNSPTFAEAFARGEFPGAHLDQTVSLSPVTARESRPVTVEQASEWVRQTEQASPFGILQVDFCDEISVEVASELAKFQGDTLIIGIKTLTPEVAAALSKSRVANVWLPSLTAVSGEAAASLLLFPGNLVLTGLVELDSVELAKKLAARRGALSFPYLKLISPDIAAALAEHEGSLALGALEEIPPAVQQELARTSGRLTLPTLQSIEFDGLAEKLSSAAIFLPQLNRLSPEHLVRFATAQGTQSFFGGVHLPLELMTPDLVERLAEIGRPGNLILLGEGPIADEALARLLEIRTPLSLQGLESLTPEQTRIIVESTENRVGSPGVLTSIGPLLPSLKRLDSASLAEKLGTGGFSGVTSISPAAAEALGNLPEIEVPRPDGTYEIRRTGVLNFPSLEELPPDIAALLMKRQWQQISLPALQDVSAESVRLMVKQTSVLQLGIPSLPPEFAEVFFETTTQQEPGGGSITLSGLTELSPESARLLVSALNRGVTDRGMNRLRFSKSPKLFLGAEYRLVPLGAFRLSEETAIELGKYEGNLAIQGLAELTDEAANALASFPGPYLILSGPASETLSSSAAESLTRVPGVLQIELRVLDSPQLAARLANQINWTLNRCEIVSESAALPLSQYRQFFDLRLLTVLDSPDLARRFVDGTTTGSSITLPALEVLSPEAAEILARGSKPLYLGLTAIDSEAVARSLSNASGGVKLPRLRAATPEVIEILRESNSIETDEFNSVFVLNVDREELPE